MLPRIDAIGCIDRAYDVLRQHISQHGDGPIPQHPGSLEIRFRTVEFRIFPASWPLQPALSYNDTIAVLGAFALKMDREGYRWWLAYIDSTGGAGQMGEALISAYEGP